METKTIKEALLNLPDEIRDMAILNVILACGKERLDQELCFSCGQDSPEVSALLGSTDLSKGVGGMDFWTNLIMELRKDYRKMVYVDKGQVHYLLHLYQMALSNLPGSLLEPITLTTHRRKNTIALVIDPKALQNLINMGVKLDYKVNCSMFDVALN